MSSPLDARLHAFRPDLADRALAGRVAAERLVDGVPARVAVTRAGLRRRPDWAATLDSELLFGEAVTVFDHANGWAWVQGARDGYVGYVPEAVLDRTREPAPATHVVAMPLSLLFSAPDIKAPDPITLPFLAPVTVTGVEGRFARLDQGGYALAGHLAPVGEILDTDWVRVAERFIGIPYLWGGRSPLGFDCSGLVQIALLAAGIAAPRDSDMQAGWGEPIVWEPDHEALIRGDLVCWKGHVGLYQGAGRLIHANATDMAVATGDLAATAARIAAGGGGPITAVRRPSGS